MVVRGLYEMLGIRPRLAAYSTSTLCCCIIALIPLYLDACLLCDLEITLWIIFNNNSNSGQYPSFSFYVVNEVVKVFHEFLGPLLTSAQKSFKCLQEICSENIGMACSKHIQVLFLFLTAVLREFLNLYNVKLMHRNNTLKFYNPISSENLKFLSNLV